MSEVLPLTADHEDEAGALLMVFRGNSHVLVEDVFAETQEFRSYIDAIEARTSLPRIRAECTWTRVDHMVNRHESIAELDEAETTATLALLDRLEGQLGDLTGISATIARGQADLARASLTRNRIGQEATEIAGVDIGGAAFRLTDYRGKVVLLGFWGFWTKACRDLIPHEKALVEKYKGRPFAIVGVESEPDLGAAQRESQKAGIPWRSFWNGPIPKPISPAFGPISGAWGIRSWPTRFLLDASGRVRCRNPKGAALDRAIESLLGELESPEFRPDSRR